MFGKPQKYFYILCEETLCDNANTVVHCSSGENIATIALSLLIHFRILFAFPSEQLLSMENNSNIKRMMVSTTTMQKIVFLIENGKQQKHKR